ncbi:MAG: hypothetical protein GY874_17365 [Desulfobacteraceae bacterium]|nr:hypothetical protein [Desulfobacteraceae bacterium]
MEISPASTNSAVAGMTRELQATAAIQIEVMKTIADGQRQFAAFLQDLGIGQHLDIRA